MESLGPKVHKPSTSPSVRPASSTAFLMASVASLKTLTPESREYGVQPIPTMATSPRGNRLGCAIVRQAPSRDQSER